MMGACFLGVGLDGTQELKCGVLEERYNETEAELAKADVQVEGRLCARGRHLLLEWDIVRPVQSSAVGTRLGVGPPMVNVVVPDLASGPVVEDDGVDVILGLDDGEIEGARALPVRVASDAERLEERVLIAAALGAISGSLFSNYYQYLSPDMVSTQVSLSLVTMLILGGEGTLLGPILGVALIDMLPQVFQSLALFKTAMEGLFVVIVLLTLPSGLVGGVLTVLGNWFARHDRSAVGTPTPGVGEVAPNSVKSMA